MTQRTRTRLSEEARFEMTLAAASRERSNRPLGLVVVACVFLAGTLIFAGSSIASRASARSRLRAELLSQAGAEAKVQEWKRLAQAAADSPQGAIGKPGEFKVSRMEELAYQRWDGERIAQEQFFYDPAQFAPTRPTGPTSAAP